MTAIGEREQSWPAATDGEIASINLESARRRAWARFAQEPRRAGVAEEILEKERLTAQFLGDVAAFDRMQALASQFASVDDSSRAALAQADVASTLHRFEDARDHLAQAARTGGPSETIERQLLTIDQACGARLDTVLAARRRMATGTGRLEDLVPLGAALSDLEHFSEADAVYRQGLRSYDGISPFPLAWVCFQLGALWGELSPARDLSLAASWYARAIAYLPRYVRARVHLAEIYASQGHADDAEALLLPALSSGDPEVRWRLAEVLFAQGRSEEAETQLAAARRGFDRLLGKYLLAFADHAAEFYAGSGGNHQRALELARTNAANRPTTRATRLAQAIELNAA
jgi:thioredoxin-like negative regulator of GroEL